MSDSIPKKHKAAVLPKPKEKHVVADRPTPQPKSNEVLIKMMATAINPVDWKIRDWGIFVEEYPAVLGSDGAGEIAAIGSGVDKDEFKIGDRVFFQGIIGNFDASTFQQYVVMPADLVGHTPDNVYDDEAAGIALAAMAVVAGFYQEVGGLDLKPYPWEEGGNKPGKGKAIVILGGSSSVGQYAVQLARLSGYETIVTGTSSSHQEFVQSLGATNVLDRNNATPQDYAKAAQANGHAFATVFDAISSPETNRQGVQILQAANPKGSDQAKRANLVHPTLVTVYTVEDAIIKETELCANGTSEKVRITTVWGIGSKPHLRKQAAAFMKAAGGPEGWLARKLFLPNRTLVISGGLSNIEEALERNKAGISGQKVIIRPFDA